MHAPVQPFFREILFFSLTSGFKYAERPGSKKPCRIGKGHFPPYGRARHPAPHASILALRFRSPDGTNVLATHVSQRRSGSQSSFKIRCPVLTHRPGPTPRQASHLFRPPTSSSFPPDFSILHPELNPAGLHAGQAFRTVFIDSLPARFDTTWLCHDLDLTRLGFGTTRIATALTSSSLRPSLARIGFHRSPPAGTIRLAGLSAFSVLVPSSAHVPHVCVSWERLFKADFFCVRRRDLASVLRLSTPDSSDPLGRHSLNIYTCEPPQISARAGCFIMTRQSPRSLMDHFCALLQDIRIIRVFAPLPFPRLHSFCRHSCHCSCCPFSLPVPLPALLGPSLFLPRPLLGNLQEEDGSRGGRQSVRCVRYHRNTFYPFVLFRYSIDDHPLFPPFAPVQQLGDPGGVPSDGFYRIIGCYSRCDRETNFRTIRFSITCKILSTRILGSGLSVFRHDVPTAADPHGRIVR